MTISQLSRKNIQALTLTNRHGVWGVVAMCG